MQAFIKNIFSFLLFSLLMYLLFLMAYGSLLPGAVNKNLKYKLGLHGFMYTRLQEADIYGNIDVLILGSSHAYRGFDTRLFAQQNLTGFNLGSSNQTPLQSRLLLKKYLPLLKPRLVIWEVYPEILCTDGVESSVDLISNSKDISFAFRNAIAVNHIIGYNTLVYSFFRKLLMGDLQYIEEKKILDDTYISGGFVEKQMKYNQSNLSEPKQSWSFNTRQINALRESIQYLKEQNISCLLVQAPVSKSLYQSYTNQTEADSLLHSLGNYVNYNLIDSIAYSDSLDFYDPDHLNQLGVVKFNSHLLKQISQISK